MRLWIIIVGTLFAVAGMVLTVYNISQSRHMTASGIFFVWNTALFCYWTHQYNKWCDETWG